MEKTAATNRKARYNYEIFEEYEAGISLLGCEVKALRDGKANIKDGFGRIEKEEVYLYNVHISPYVHSRMKKIDPDRKRKLLLHKKEIKRLIGKTQEKGFTLVPLEIYFKKGKAKVSLALAKGKRKYDKRQAMKKKEAQREIRKYMK